MFLKKTILIPILLFVFLVFSPSTYFCSYLIYEEFLSNELYGIFHFSSTRNDPFEGNTRFLDENETKEKNMIKDEDKKLRIDLDYTKLSSGNKRESIRLESPYVYEEGLFVWDFSKIPRGCSIDSSFGLLAENVVGKPSIIEAFGVSNKNLWRGSLFTEQTCDLSKNPTDVFEGTWLTPKKLCDWNTADDRGCSIQAKDATIATNLNIKDSVVVLEVKKNEHVRMWYFEKSSVPTDLISNSPDPESWKKMPYAAFRFGPDCFGSEFHHLRPYLQVTYCPKIPGCEFSDECIHKMASKFPTKQDACIAFSESDILNTSTSNRVWEINNFRYYINVSSSKTNTVWYKPEKPSSEPTNFPVTTFSSSGDTTKKTLPTEKTENPPSSEFKRNSTILCPPISGPPKTIAQFRGVWHVNKKLSPILPCGDVVYPENETEPIYSLSGISSFNLNTKQKNDSLSSWRLHINTFDNINQSEFQGLNNTLEEQIGNLTEDFWETFINPINDKQSLEDYHAKAYDILKKKQIDFHQQFPKQN